MKHLPNAERIAAAVSYCTLLPAVLLLLVPAYRKSTFVRFHAWQSMFLWGFFLIATAVALFLSNFIGTVALLLMGVLAAIAMFFLWIVLVLKSWQGELFELPVFARLAGYLR